MDIDNVWENARRVIHDYTVGNLVYVEITVIDLKLDNDKKGQYRITEVFTNSTVRIQSEKAHEIINIRQLTTQLSE